MIALGGVRACGAAGATKNNNFYDRCRQARHWVVRSGQQTTGWRGSAAKTLNISKDPDKNYHTLEKAMAKLFRNYPQPRVRGNFADKVPFRHVSADDFGKCRTIQVNGLQVPENNRQQFRQPHCDWSAGKTL